MLDSKSMELAILIVSILGTYFAYKSMRYAKRQGMPNFALIQHKDGSCNYKVAMNNSTVVVRLDEYGYRTFDGKKVSVSQVVDQYATYTSTDWGQRLVFDSEPSKEGIYYYYIHEVHNNKTHRFYPNGKWRSKLKYWFSCSSAQEKPPNER